MPADARRESLETWLDRIGVERNGALEPTSSDASFRRYFRVPTVGGTRVAMDAPPSQEPIAPFVDVQRRLAAAGLHVPEVLAEDRDQGFLLLTDLGRVAYLDRLDHEEAEDLMHAALDALVRMQSRADPAGLPEYDRVRLETELDLFPTWYVQAHLGLEPDQDWWDRWLAVRALLVERALAQPRTFVHRDYMPRNLMVADPAPGILDFQDAVSGPVTYDLASLLRDAFASWPDHSEQAFIDAYLQRARAAGLALHDDDTAFRADLDAMAAQRHLKVLGIFARLHHRDAKPRYLADAPRFLRYLATEARAHRDLAPLADLLAALPEPAVA